MYCGWLVPVSASDHVPQGLDCGRARSHGWLQRAAGTGAARRCVRSVPVCVHALVAAVVTAWVQKTHFIKRKHYFSVTAVGFSGVVFGLQVGDGGVDVRVKLGKAGEAGVSSQRLQVCRQGPPPPTGPAAISTWPLLE